MQYRLLRSQVSLIEYLELDKYTMNTYAYPSIYIYLEGPLATPAI